MKIIPDTEAFNIDVKRFYTPFSVEDTCPQCGHEVTWGPDLDYLSYPTVNEAFDLTMYCTECDHNWKHRVVLHVTLEAVEDKPVGDQPVSEERVLTQGRLDGLVISPIVKDDGEIVSLHLTVKDLPGLRLVLEADAARELRDALTMILDGGK